MTATGVILDSVLPVLLIIGAGFAFSRIRRIDVRTLVDVVIYVAIPCLVISVLTKHPPSGRDTLTLLGAGSSVVLGVVLMAALARRLGLMPSRAGLLCAPFANAINLPVPLAMFTFGQAAVANQVIYATANMTLMYTLGIWLAVGGRKGLTSLLRLPPVYAVILGYGLAMSGTDLPPVVARPVELLGACAVPLLLFTLGYRLSDVRFGHLRQGIMPVLLRMAGGLAIACLFIMLVRPSVPVTRAILLGAPMPPAVQTFMLAQKFEVDPTVAAAAVTLGSLAAMALMPILVPILALST